MTSDRDRTAAAASRAYLASVAVSEAQIAATSHAGRCKFGFARRSLTAGNVVGRFNPVRTDDPDLARQVNDFLFDTGPR